MPVNISVASVIDKNKISSNTVWVVLMEVDIVDPNTRNVVDTIYVAKDSDPVIFQDNIYQPFNFEIEYSVKKDSAPDMSVSFQDQMRFISSKMEAVAGGVFSNVKMMVVNTARLDQPPEIEEVYQVISAGVQNFVISAKLGVENPLTMQFPKHTQRQDRCAWRFKGYGCGYTGTNQYCDYTANGANGCKVNGNYQNFRAEPGLVIMTM